MDKPTAVLFSAMALYASGGFLTAARYEQKIYRPCYEATKTDLTKSALDCGIPPFVGMVWPLYWAWHASLYVTR